MANTVYTNFFLSNEVEDQLASKLNLQPFCTIDNSLVGTVGMKRIINTYRATDGTEKLTIGQGNSKSIEVSYTPKEYTIALAQNRFEWYDEHAMTDDMLVPTGMKHAGTDMYNTIEKDIMGEFQKTGLVVEATAFDYDAFIDASSALNVENVEGLRIFAFVHPKDKAKIRKNLKDSLQYVEAYARQGYIGSVAGIDIYDSKLATEGEIIVATKEAVTVFNKKGVEVEIPPRSSDDANVRKNTAFSRKYYVVALTDESKAVKLTLKA